jgi:hypothetical protein
MSFIKAGVCIDFIEGKGTALAPLKKLCAAMKATSEGDVLENGRKPLHQSVAQANWSLRYHK